MKETVKLPWPMAIAKAPSPPRVASNRFGKVYSPTCDLRAYDQTLSQALLSITNTMAEVQRKLQELSEKYQSLQAGKQLLPAEVE